MIELDELKDGPKAGDVRCVKYWHSFFHDYAYRIERYSSGWLGLFAGWRTIEDNKLASRMNIMLKRYKLDWDDIVED